MPENKSAVPIPQTVIDDVKKKVQEAINALAPYTVPLSEEERRDIPKMGQKTIGFVNKVNDYLVVNPQFVPPYMTADALKTDIGNYNAANPAWMAANQLATILSDILLLSGSEAFTGSLQYYNQVKMSDHNNVAGAKSVYNDLKERFPGRSKKSVAPTP